VLDETVPEDNVLPRPEYEEEQLAGAINISLKQMTEEPLP
jgi:hypothetical protein